jgi:hypothetical protein
VPAKEANVKIPQVVIKVGILIEQCSGFSFITGHGSGSIKANMVPKRGRY